MASSRTGGAFGYLKKSIGSVTYSTMRDGSGKRIQVVRSKPTEVTNPNTVAQILQRMKVKPAARFYNALSEILSNSYEGVNYGTDSRREFMRLAMTQVGPYVPKGATRFIPAMYPVSRGSLNSIGFAYKVSENVSSRLYGEKGFVAYFNSEDDMDGSSLSAIANSYYGRDVQLTFVAVTQTADGSFVPHYGRILTSDHQESYPTAFNVSFDGITVAFSQSALYIMAGQVDESAAIDVWKNGFAGIVAAAVIVSVREGENWVRSNSDMLLTPALEINLYGTEARTVAIESYQSFASVNELNNAWYLNLANGQQYPGRLALQTVTLQFSVEQEGETVTIERELVAPFGTQVDADGRTRTEVFADASGNAIFNVNGQYQTVDEPGTTPATPIKWSDVLITTQFYGSRIVTWKEAYSIQIG